MTGEYRWGKSPPPLAARVAATNRFRKRHPEVARAWNRVQRAVATGKLIRPDACARCGVPCKPEGSHDDYSKPLEVEWLCRMCHVQKDKGKRNDC